MDADKPVVGEITLALTAARAAFGRVAYQEALDCFRNIVRLRSDMPEAIAGLAQCLRQLRQFEEAQTLLAESLDRFPHNFELLDEHAKLAEALAMSAGGGREAWLVVAARWAAVRAVFPDFLPAYWGGAWGFRRVQRWDDAVAIVTEAAERFPDAFEPQFDLANIALDRGDFAQGLQRWADIRRQFPNDPRGYIFGSMALQLAERLDDAEALIAEGMQKFPADSGVCIAFATSATKRQAWSVAVQRWRTAFEAWPSDTQIALGLSEALVETGAYDEAEELVRGIMLSLRNDSNVLCLFANIATRRGAWPEAMARWSHARRLFPDDTRIAGNFMAAKMRAILDDQPTHVDAGLDMPDSPYGGPAAMPDEATLELPETVRMRAIFADFESMGDDCEFGIVQRGFGLEPLGLLRWMAISADRLIDGLNSQFEGVGELTQTEIFPIRGEYITGDQRYFMHMHTFIGVHEADPQVLLPKLCKRLKILRRKFLEDLHEARKIFVYKSKQTISDATIRQLSAALCSFAENRLLVVMQENASYPSGTLRFLAPHILVGYIENFHVNAPVLPVWKSLCERAHGVFAARLVIAGRT
jgi:tetratricopeptide (TPR) repeat protein